MLVKGEGSILTLTKAKIFFPFPLFWILGQKVKKVKDPAPHLLSGEKILVNFLSSLRLGTNKTRGEVSLQQAGVIRTIDISITFNSVS